MRPLAVVRTGAAEQDLIDIWHYIAQDSPAAADRMLDCLEARWELLSEYPYTGQAADEILPDVRRVVIGNYLTFYRVERKTIRVLRVLHGRRDITSGDLDV